MEYIIVPMDRGHIPQIAALERECFSTPWSENMLPEPGRAGNPADHQELF